MPPKASLHSLKLKDLKELAFSAGLPTTGYRAELANAIHHTIENRPSHNNAVWKIVSVDMGIRNLAFCAIEAPLVPKRSPLQLTQIDVRSWVRMDLLKKRDASETNAQKDGEELIESAGPDVQRGLAGSEDVSKIEKGAFEPEMLSRTAYKVTCEVLRHKPDVILIERQRFRSGGAAPIQEWTVRVNMLESMIWACLETLRAQGQNSNQSFPDVIPMNPSRVASYWLAGQSFSRVIQGKATDPQDSLSPSGVISKDKVPGESILKKLTNTKEQKVSTVRSWISGESDISLSFERTCAHIAEAFRLQQKKAASELAGGKLDDLADCLLQAVTWVRWQQNRQEIHELYGDLSGVASSKNCVGIDGSREGAVAL